MIPKVEEIWNEITKMKLSVKEPKKKVSVGKLRDKEVFLVDFVYHSEEKIHFFGEEYKQFDKQ